MKRFALIAAAAALAAPAVFAQTVILEPASSVLNHGAVAVSPPVDGQPGSSVVIMNTPLAMSTTNTAVLGAGPVVMVEPSDTTILGAPAATFSGSTIQLGGTALLDVPAYATGRPDFQRWMAWEGSHVVR